MQELSTFTSYSFEAARLTKELKRSACLEFQILDELHQKSKIFCQLTLHG